MDWLLRDHFCHWGGGHGRSLKTALVGLGQTPYSQPQSPQVLTEKSPMLLTGSRESSQHGLNSEHPVLLNNSPPQGKLFCKSQIHLGFYQSLTNLRERKYSFPAPYSLPILLKGEKF